MIIGEMLAESGTARYSPWFDRRGDGAGFGCRALAVSSGFLQFTVTVQTKDRDQLDGSASNVVTLAPLTAVGDSVAQGTGLKELVRYKYMVGSDPLSGVERVHFEMLDPMWREN